MVKTDVVNLSSRNDLEYLPPLIEPSKDYLPPFHQEGESDVTTEPERIFPTEKSPDYGGSIEPAIKSDRIHKGDEEFIDSPNRG